MVQIILLVLGIIALVRYPRLRKLSASDYPGVDPAAFAVWLAVEKSAAIWLIVATIGVFIVSLAGGFVLGFVMAMQHAKHDAIVSASLVLNTVFVVIFLALLVVAAIKGSRASKLKKAAGIPWPKKAQKG